MSSGFRVTLTAWLPCGDDLDSLIAAREAIDWMKAHAVEHGFEEIAVATEFKQFRRRAKEPDGPPSPPSAPDPAEPPQPLDNAPAGTVAGGASNPQRDPPTAGAIHGLCNHQSQKKYGNGAIVCLDCQAIVAEAGAA